MQLVIHNANGYVTTQYALQNAILCVLIQNVKWTVNRQDVLPVKFAVKNQYVMFDAQKKCASPKIALRAKLYADLQFVVPLAQHQNQSALRYVKQQNVRGNVKHLLNVLDLSVSLPVKSRNVVRKTNFQVLQPVL